MPDILVRQFINGNVTFLLNSKVVWSGDYELDSEGYEEVLKLLNPSIVLQYTNPARNNGELMSAERLKEYSIQQSKLPREFC